MVIETEQTLSLQQLTEQRDTLLMQSEIADLTSRLQPVHEATSVPSLIDYREMLFDSPGFGGGHYNPTTTHPQDRKHGRYRPVFETESQLNQIRGMARWLTASDETAIGVMENLVNYIIGTGFEYAAVARNETGESSQLIARVQSVIDNFLERNDWDGDLDRELFVRSRRDGEFFLRLHHVGGGLTEARLVEPEFVTEPADKRFMNEYVGADSLDWTFGVASDIRDVQRVHGFHVQWDGDPNDWEFVPVSEMIHAKLNVDRNIKRGLSDFFPTEKKIKRAAKVLRNTAEGAAIQAAIAYITEDAKGTAKGDIETLRSAQTDHTLRQSTPDGGTRTTRTRRFDPGTILNTVGRQYKPGPMGSQRVPPFISVVQAVLRSVAVRWSMPENMISGDASNANFASLLVAEGPFVKSAEAKQMYYKRQFENVIWIVLKTAADHGAFGVDFAALRRLVNLSITPPRVSSRNRQEETTIRSTLSQAGVMSRKTWAAQEDLDYDVERQNIEDEPPLTMTGGPLVPGSTSQVALQAALESVETTDEARQLLQEVYP